MADKNGLDGALDRLDDGFDQSGRASAAFETELARLRQSMLFTTREVGTLSTGIEGGLRRAFTGLAVDGASLSDTLKGVAKSMADTVFAIAMKPINQAIAGTIAGGMGQALSGAMPFARGGAISEGRVRAFAKGGVVSEPVTFPMRGATGLMGEAGPEAIMPLRRGADGRLGVAAPAGGAGRAVNVTFNITTPDVAGFQRSRSQIAAEMSRLMAQGNRNG